MREARQTGTVRPRSAIRAEIGIRHRPPADISQLACPADVTWYELAWLAQHERIIVTIPVGSWLRRLSTEVRTIGITPAIAHAAAGPPLDFSWRLRRPPHLRQRHRAWMAAGNKGPGPANASQSSAGRRLVRAQSAASGVNSGSSMRTTMLLRVRGGG